MKFRFMSCRSLPSLLLPLLLSALPLHAEEAAKAAEASSRAVVQQRIADAALAAMARSDEAEAVMIAAKWARKAGLKDGETRTDEERNALQAAALEKALKLAKTPSEMVDYQVMLFCNGFPKLALCENKHTAWDFANQYSDNALGWITAAGYEFASRSNELAQLILDKGRKSTRSDWFYSQTLAIARRYVHAVVEKDAQAGDRDVATFIIAGELTLPPLPRFAQMCNPDSSGKLPDGRYALCRAIADIVLEQGHSAYEHDVAMRTLLRLAQGEKDEAGAQKWTERFNARREATTYLWNTKMKYPPQTAEQAKDFALYVDDCIAVGEVKAMDNALKRFGKSVEDFIPKTEKKPEQKPEKDPKNEKTEKADKAA